MHDAIDAEVRVTGAAVAIREEEPQESNLALFGTSDPMEVIQKASGSPTRSRP